ncbi:MAG: lytic transglycosylase domain-containing protein [Candidatus Binatia bacterium]
MERTTSRRLGPLAGLLLLSIGSVSLAACKSGHQGAKATPPAAPAKKSSSVTQGGKPVPLPAAGAGASATSAAESEVAGGVEEPGSRELQPDEPAAAVVEPTPAAPLDPEALLHESMEAYESADKLWKEGDSEDAIAALDYAYERMSEVLPLEGDPLLAQEKENLRSLISRRIVQIYASRQASVGDLSASIPMVMNSDVQYEITSFQGRERQFFLEAYQRSGTYRPHIVAELAKAGMPEQLSWLPLVESGFKDRALSTARALGLWQFIPSTGYRYGLDRSDSVDERMDPEKATQAAIAYLTALHNLFGDWMTALAAYNCGEHNVLRAINNQKLSYFDQFWDLYQRLPRETRRYVPRFLATLTILEDPKKYGFTLPAVNPPL